MGMPQVLAPDTGDVKAAGAGEYMPMGQPVQQMAVLPPVGQPAQAPDYAQFQRAPTV